MLAIWQTSLNIILHKKKDSGFSEFKNSKSSHFCWKSIDNFTAVFFPDTRQYEVIAVYCCTTVDPLGAGTG